MQHTMRMRFLWVLLFLAVPFCTHADYIDSFASDITVSSDSSFVVVEQIDYVFTGFRHGIYRYIPTTHPDKARQKFKERYTDIHVVDVTMDGKVVPYEVSTESDRVYIKIGDPNQMIDGGHRYTIRYGVAGGISFPPNEGADLYWNVTGNSWEVPMHSVEARVSSPDPIIIRERSCYRGLVGASASCDRVEEASGTILFSARELEPGEGMTIAQALNRSKIDRVILERWKPLWLWIPIFVLWFGALGTFVYRYRTANRTGRTIIPQYEPYPGIKPMYTGLLFDGRLDPQDITACIVYLAEQGFLKIRKTESKVMFFFEVDDYEITLVKPLDETVGQFERSILTLLFGDTFTPGAVVTLNTLKRDMVQRQKNYQSIVALKKSLEEDLVTNGFFQTKISPGLLVGAFVLLVFVLVFFFSFLITVLSTNAIFALILIIGSAGILGLSNRRRTMKGYEALDHLLGFKEFLGVTDKERFEFHNAPEKSPQQFMEYLPYAIAFGVEEKWAEVFKDVVIENPGWYDGGSGPMSFSAVNLTSSLGAFSTAFAASSGTSPSSGGGSSGGGGGGGGGGSW